MAGIGEQNMENIVDGAVNVGDRVMDKVSDLSQTATDVAKRMARDTVAGVQRSAQYFHNNGIQQVAEDLRDYAKSNPTQAMVGAAVLGFVLGRLMSRD